MTTDFANKTVIITGAGIGIGFAIAKALAWQGANVLLNDYDEQLAQNAAEVIRQAGGVCDAFPGDASDVSFIQQMVDTAVNRFGSVDIAIANAGITIFGDIFTTTPESFQKIVDLNLRGSFFLAQIAAKQMREQKRGGSVLFMSSVVGHMGIRVCRYTA